MGIRDHLEHGVESHILERKISTISAEENADETKLTDDDAQWLFKYYENDKTCATAAYALLTLV